MTTHGGDIRMTEQELLNESYDWLLSLLGVSLWGYDGTIGADGARRVSVDPSGRLVTKSQETIPTDPTKVNSSDVLEYVDSNLVSITKTIDGEDYVKTFGYDVYGNPTDISEWIKI